MLADSSPGLPRESPFVMLWAAQGISVFGSAISTLALPLTAVLTLDATASQIGVLNAMQFLPFLLVGLLAGVWVDRIPRRPVLILTDLLRALLLGSIPVAVSLDALTMEHLYVVGFLAGICTVFFDVAYQSFLPAIVAREQLIEGNSKLEATRALAQVVGPGLAGLLVQMVSAAAAVGIDALSYLISGALLWRIRTPHDRASSVPRRGVWREIGEGLRYVGRHSLIRPLVLCVATSNLFSTLAFTVVVLYLSRTLGLTPFVVGLVFASLGVGALVGAVLASRIACWLGLGRAMTVSIALGGPAFVLVALAGGTMTEATAVSVVAFFLLGFGGPVFNVNAISLRQAITPEQMLGRLNATVRFVVWGTIPIGALLSGVLGERIGLRATLVVGGLCGMTAPLWLLWSSIWPLPSIPETGEA